MDNMEKVRQVIVEAVQNLPIPDDAVDEMPLFVRAFLKGKHPIEFAAGMIANLPDEYIPHIVTVAKAIVDAAG